MHSFFFSPGSTLNDSRFQELLQACPVLRTLNISGDACDSPSSCALFIAPSRHGRSPSGNLIENQFELLATQLHRSLTDVDMSNCLLSSERLLKSLDDADAQKCLHRLRRFTAANNDLDEAAILRLLEANPELNSLYIAGKLESAVTKWMRRGGNS